MNWGAFKHKRTAGLTTAAMIVAVFGYSQRSITNINEVREPLQIVTICAKEQLVEPISMIIIDGGRTWEEHKINVANGKSWIKRSRHQDAAAIDFAATVNGEVTYDLTYYGPIVKAFKFCSEKHQVPIISGCDWKAKDCAHIELDKRFYP